MVCWRVEELGGLLGTPSTLLLHKGGEACEADFTPMRAGSHGAVLTTFLPQLPLPSLPCPQPNIFSLQKFQQSPLLQARNLLVGGCGGW